MNPKSIEYLHKAIRTYGCGCALERLRQYCRYDLHFEVTNLLTDCAIIIGFTEHEAKGIMDGWDELDTGAHVFASEYKYTELNLTKWVEYRTGKEIGADCYKISRERFV